MANVCVRNANVQTYNDLEEAKRKLQDNNEATAEEWRNLEEGFASFSGEEDFPDAEKEKNDCHEMAKKAEYDYIIKIKKDLKKEEGIIYANYANLRNSNDDLTYWPGRLKTLFSNLQYAVGILEKLGDYRDAAKQAKDFRSFKVYKEIEKCHGDVNEYIKKMLQRRSSCLYYIWIIFTVLSLLGWLISIFGE